MTEYIVGQQIKWLFGDCIIESISNPVISNDNNDTSDINVENKSKDVKVYIRAANFGLSATVTPDMLKNVSPSLDKLVFKNSHPTLLSVENFYEDPNYIRELALVQNYHTNIKAFKGKRTTERFLFPAVKERFEQLLGVKIRSWLNHATNGVFQITGYNDPLVYHSDLQSYAAAIYLTPNAPVGAGTSFWRDKTYGCRRPPSHKLEKHRFVDDEAILSAQEEIYSKYNLVHPDNWELVDKAGSIFNRLVIWDSQMIHSASSYDAFVNDKCDISDEAANSRLVQLFFFDIEA